MPYQPTIESLSTHPVPDWFQDAKLGIFVHYGLFSVPGWAVASQGDINETIHKLGFAGHFRNNPYAEWYLNTLRIPGSPTEEYHRRTYGAGFSYDDFVPHFNEANARWDPEAWAGLFQKAGARYVVLTSKHCESFLLWPSAHPNPFKKDYTARRDVVGELASAVRGRGMRMGIYYCGGFDWTFNTRPITVAADMLLSIPQSQAYVDYCTAHWRELVERYQPAVMWGDVGYPSRADVLGLFAHYYNTIPDGVINDRFYHVNLGLLGKLAWFPGVRGLISRAIERALERREVNILPLHCDFRTPEYAAFAEIREKKWESCRGLGYSFGYNRSETAEHMLSVEGLVHLLIDIVSKNGNLLLNVGPMADGTISALQVERLEGLGSWLAVNGEAIFGTRPWKTSSAQTREGIELRFTCTPEALYAILLGVPAGNQVTLSGLCGGAETRVHLLGCEPALAWRQADDGITIDLPDRLDPTPALALKLTPLADFL